MKTKMLIMLALIFTLVLAASASGLASADEAVVPFKAYYAGVPVGIFDPTCLCLRQTFEFDGNATHLGLSHFSALGQTSVLNDMPQSGYMTLTAADGYSELSGYYEGNGVAMSPGVFEFGGVYWIDSGTGRFEGVTGEGVYWGTATTGANAWGDLYFDGLLYK
jgi:hypothetical protein